jgi:hypothetical protein
MSQANKNSFLIRTLNCLMLKSDAYEEVEHDESATKQALIIVLMSSSALGLMQCSLWFASFSAGVILSSIIFGVLSWALFAWMTYFIGTKIFRTDETEADWGQLARTLGFANAPRILLFAVLFVSDDIIAVIATVVSIWVLITTVIAIRQALELNNIRAIGTGVVSNIIISIPFLFLF